MAFRCKVPFCNATDVEKFYEYNRSVCKSCLSQRRKMAKNTADIKNEKTKKAEKTKSDSKNNSSLMHIISTQQKMIENQQLQTNALLSLTEKLLDRVNVSSSSPKSSTPVFRPVISHTPRKRQHLVHYKDRLNNDI